MTLDVPAFLIEHPRAGLIVVGTGLAPSLRQNPEAELGWLVAALVEVTVKDGQDLMRQLKDAGFAPEKVRRVILMDCRFPQTGQVAQFPEADVTVARAEREWALGAGFASGVRRADVLAVHRWDPIDMTDTEPLGTFPHAQDLLGDGSVMLLDASGYSPGTTAVLVRLASGPVVIAGGVAPRAGTLRAPIIPAVATDREQWWLAIWRLKRFRELAEGLLVIPGFDASAFEDDDARADLRLHRVASSSEKKEGTSEPPGRRREQPALPVPDPPAVPPPFGR
jgi:hypothetical protein